MLFRSVLVCLFAAFSLVACSAPPSILEQSADGFLRIGVKYDQPGTGYVEHEKYSGFDVDLAYHLARELDRTPRLDMVSSGTRAVGLTAEPRLHDMVVASYSINSDREDEVDFIGPYAVTSQGVMVRRGDDRIRKTEHLDGRTVCTAGGTTSLEQLEEIAGIIPLGRKDFSQCVDELRNGVADAISTDQMILYGFVQKYPEFKLVPGIKMDAPNLYGVAIPEGQPEDCAKIKNVIKEFVTSSEWSTLFEQHLESIPAPESYKPDPGLIDKYSCNPDTPGDAEG